MGSLDAGPWPGAGGARSARDARSAITRRRGASLAVCAGNDDDDDLFSFLEAQMATEDARREGWDDPHGGGIVGEEGSPMDGEELRLLVLNKWGKMYDTHTSGGISSTSCSSTYR